MLVELREAHDARRFGGKAASLARALVAGLPTPDGWALPASRIDEPRVARACEVIAAACTGPLAVRSSAVGEDGVAMSFAGQFLTRLGVVGRTALRRAVLEVAGAHGDALGYRERHGAGSAPAAVGVVVQPMVDAEVAGVLFTRHPVTAAVELVVEASWGLGVSVVEGSVTPDHWRLAPGGEVLATRLGDKRSQWRLRPDGMAEQVALGAHQASRASLDPAALRALAALAGDTQRVFGDALDIEWAFAGGRLWLLQCRPITAIGTPARR